MLGALSFTAPSFEARPRQAPRGTANALIAGSRAAHDTSRRRELKRALMDRFQRIHVSDAYPGAVACPDLPSFRISPLVRNHSRGASR
jgi:hypothetical protein